MLVRQSLQIKKFLNVNSNYLLKRNTRQTTKSKDEYNLETVFSPHREKKPEKEQFLKSLILGKFDQSILSYPETQPFYRYKEFFNWLKPIEDYISSCTDPNKKLDKENLLGYLRDLEVFRAYVDEENGGLNLLETESLKLIETLSTIPWLGTYIVKNHIIPIQIISKYGSVSQKLEYLPKIMSGEIIPTVCIKEDNNMTNINNMKCEAVPTKENSWSLSGKKSFVVNGTNANLFFVFAHSLTGNIYSRESISLFLVEKKFGGVTCTEVYETIGRHDIPTCTIAFENTLIPNKNVIGEPGKALDLMLDLLTPGRQNISAQAISILRNFINKLTTDVTELEHFDRNYHEFGAVRKVISDSIFSLYTMESMAYLTSGLADAYENADVQLERIITETYCANQCLKSIQLGLQLVGAQSYLNNSFYIQSFHDALALTTMDSNNVDASVYVATSLFKHLGQFVHNHIYKKRNATKFPIFAIISDFLNLSASKIEIKANVHPSLKLAGYFLEEAIKSFNQVTRTLLEHHGADIVKHQIELIRVTEMLTEIYAGIANLSRSSRSYNIGLRNGDIEKSMTVCLSYGLIKNMTTIKKEIEEGESLNADYVRVNMSDTAYQQRQYPLEHPLSRTL
ncbi:complex I assembly factor ACAD9, mitochondrial-like [Hylaeus anthracinus]|uniref:complex I assembly factor ACAD9, mitochondrial-like n=1 Tax=Hylaeus anthracinus TaxID=313031 RepID=UPI0023B8ED76|nr:complex I assembly factor ACAD9, mitochondrial-like [Hylaeus anthracinus]